MDWKNVIDVLLEKACPSIKYRIYRDILMESPSYELERIYADILDDPQIKYAFSQQKNDGYFGDTFHSGFRPNGKYKGKMGVEGILRFLIEKGIELSEPRMKMGIEALKKDNWIGPENGKGIWCVHYKELGMYEPEFIRAVILAIAGAISKEDLNTFVNDTVEVFSGILNIASFEEITEDFMYSKKLYKVYKKGIIFPESYHLRMLAYSTQWRNGNDRVTILNGIKKLIELSPLQDVRVKHKSRWLGPAGIAPKKLNIDLCDLAVEGWDDNWAYWFHTFELFARMGIVKDIPELKKQADQLKNILEEGNGLFIHNFKEKYFNGWSIYHGIALENDWKQERGIYDLTFRSLFILHLSGLLD